MRNFYYKFLFENHLLNYLDNIQELSYSKKLKILKSLMKTFSSEEVNKGLVKYYSNYILLNRVEILKLEGILKGLCKKEL